MRLSRTLAITLFCHNTSPEYSIKYHPLRRCQLQSDMAVPPALAAGPGIKHLDPLKQAPLFPPRPILLRFKEESRGTEQGPNRIDPSKIIMDEVASPITISVEKANILQSQRGRACESQNTNYHDLKCGHLATPSTKFPTTNSPKAPCASNCCRTQPMTHGTLTPFVCPMCLETLLRRNYIKTYKEFTAAGFCPDPDPTENVKKWLCSSIRLVSKFGPRIVQGTSGLFLLGDEDNFMHIKFMPSVVSDIYGHWSFEGRRRKRDRSRSPGRYGRMSRTTNTRAQKDQSVSRGRVLERDQSRSQKMASPGFYRDRLPLRTTTTIDLDSLAERLSDTRIGLLEDGEVDNLLQRVAKI